MKETCQIRYGVTFPLSAKISVNGSGTHPIFKYLKDNIPNGILGKTIKRNFTKFLIDRKGHPVHRYAPTTTPEDIEDDIKKLL
jgi:glutathione peroxidase